MMHHSPSASGVNNGCHNRKKVKLWMNSYVSLIMGCCLHQLWYQEAERVLLPFIISTPFSQRKPPKPLLQRNPGAATEFWYHLSALISVTWRGELISLIISVFVESCSTAGKALLVKDHLWFLTFNINRHHSSLLVRVSLLYKVWNICSGCSCRVLLGT